MNLIRIRTARLFHIMIDNVALSIKSEKFALSSSKMPKTALGCVLLDTRNGVKSLIRLEMRRSDVASALWKPDPDFIARTLTDRGRWVSSTRLLYFTKRQLVRSARKCASIAEW